MFVNLKIIRIYSFCPFSLWKKDKCILKEVLWQKQVSLPWPLKMPHRGGMGGFYKDCKNLKKNLTFFANLIHFKKLIRDKKSKPWIYSLFYMSAKLEYSN